MGPCCVSTRSQSYPLCASCSATVGLCALRNRPILGCPARNCFLNSDPLSAGSGISVLLEMELRSVPYEPTLPSLKLARIFGVTAGQIGGKLAMSHHLVERREGNRGRRKT